MWSAGRWALTSIQPAAGMARQYILGILHVNHDNTSGLPSSLNVYSGGSIGCKYVNDSSTGINPLSPAGQAPHMIDFAIW